MNNTTTVTTPNSDNHRNNGDIDFDRFPLSGDAYRWLQHSLPQRSQTLWRQLVTQARKAGRQLEITEIESQVAAAQEQLPDWQKQLLAAAKLEAKKPETTNIVQVNFQPRLEQVVTMPKVTGAPGSEAIEKIEEKQQPTPQHEAGPVAIVEDESLTKVPSMVPHCSFPGCKVEQDGESFLPVQHGDLFAKHGFCAFHRELLAMLGAEFRVEVDVTAEVARRNGYIATWQHLLRQEDDKPVALRLLRTIIVPFPFQSEQ